MEKYIDNGKAFLDTHPHFLQAIDALKSFAIVCRVQELKKRNKKKCFGSADDALSI